LISDSAARWYIDQMAASAAMADPESREAVLQGSAYLRNQLAMITGDTIRRSDGTPLTVTALPGEVIVGPPGTYPVPGKLTLVVLLPPGNAVPNRRALRRLEAKFGDSLHVAFVASTRGYLGLQASLDFSEEARLLRDYFADSLQVTSPVLLQATPIDHRPAPDGRIVYGTTESQQLYPGLLYLLVDGNGVARTGASQWWGSTEERLERSIARILAAR